MKRPRRALLVPAAARDLRRIRAWIAADSGVDRANVLLRALLDVVERIAELPALTEDQLPELPLREARAVVAPFMSLTIDALDNDLLQDTEARLLSLSEAISARYFLQYEKSEAPARDNLLA